MGVEAVGTSDRTPLARRPLVIAVEATRLAKETRGIGRYVRALLPRIGRLRPGTHVVLFVKPRDVLAQASRCADTGLRNVEVKPIGAMRDLGADVFWYPWNVVARPPKRGVVVATVHDVAPIALPDRGWRDWRRSRRWWARYRATADRAQLLIVDSTFTRDEVARTLGVAHDKMRVVPLAADSIPTACATQDPAVLRRLGVRPPFILYVGADDVRKNLSLVFRSMELLTIRHPGVSLVMAGPTSRVSLPEATRPWVTALGVVTDGELASLYRSASCLVMPSRYEGFGLPVLEAMSAGLPVVCALSSSLPEVGGDAVVWIDPDDEVQLASACSRVLSDHAWAARLGAKGRCRAAQFCWDKTAWLTLDAFDAAIGGPPAAAPVLTRLLDVARARVVSGVRWIHDP